MVEKGGTLRRPRRWGLLPLVFFLLAEGGARAEALLNFQIDPAQSEVLFDGETWLHNLDGVARRFQGEVKAPASLYGKGVSGRVVIDPTSIDTGNSWRDRQMRERTLEVKKFPEIVFLIDSVEAEGEAPAQRGPMRLLLTGRILLHGVTREKRLPVTVHRREGGGFVVSGRFPLRLSEHEIPDPSLFFNRVRDELIAIFKFTVLPAK
jgi:polyisoprenoid-binding protein YceI